MDEFEKNKNKLVRSDNRVVQKKEEGALDRVSDQNVTQREEKVEKSAFINNVEDISPPSSPRRSKKLRVGEVAVLLFLLAVFIVALSALCVALVTGKKYISSATDPSYQIDEVTDTTSDKAEEKVIFIREYDESSGLMSTAELYAKCSDSVVSITTKDKTSEGVGSGFIISSDGYIATASHVIEGKSEINVILTNEDQYSATVIASDSLTDIALIKIDAQALPTVKFGDSSSMIVGEKVIAIGTPASVDFAGSVCSGEISYLDRIVNIRNSSDGKIYKKMRLIQNTAQVNPGNSGCPLFNEYGEVIGMITMKLGMDFDGIGFAIPSDSMEQILLCMIRGEALTDEMLSTVAVSAPKLGIMGNTDSQDGIMGVRVSGFPSGSGASSILKEGDLIIQIDSVPIGDVSDIEKSIGDKAPSDTVSVTVLRNGQRLSFELTLTK